MKYYIAENGQPAGPFELKELLEHGLTVNSQVWNETMDNWASATQVPEVYNLLRGAAVQQAGQPYQPQQPREQGQQNAPATSNQQYAPAADSGHEAYQPQQPQQQYAQPQQQYAQPQQQQYAQPQQQQYAQPQQQYAQPQQGQAQQYGQVPYYGEHQYAQPQYAQPAAPMPNDWKAANITITILSVLCCCNVIALITGIVGISKSNSVRTMYNYGDYQRADEAAQNARMWFFISLALLVVGAIMSTIYLMKSPEFNNALAGQI